MSLKRSTVKADEQSTSEDIVDSTTTSTAETSASKVNKFKGAILYGLLGLTTFAIPLTWYLSKPTVVNNSLIESKIKEVGSIVAQTEDGALRAYTIDTKSGDRMIIFATKDGKYLLLGNAFDRATGEPAFKSMIEKVEEKQALDQGHIEGDETGRAATISAKADDEPGQAVFDAEPTFEIPQVIKYLDSLPGFKEDASKKDYQTVYAFYDPRCPYCHQLYESTRNLKLDKVTIKWLPTLALGDAELNSEDARRAVAGLNEAGKLTSEQFGKLFSKSGSTPTELLPEIATQEQIIKLEQNKNALLSAGDHAYGVNSPKSVPGLIWLDKRTGAPRMVFGGSDAATLRAIFGE